MANAPLTNFWFPEEKDWSRVIAAYTTAAAGAGPGLVTLTIPNEYPPIDRTITCPILAILMCDNTVAGMIVDSHEFFALGGIAGVGGQMGALPGAALVPDSQGEFLITGARTIDIWQMAGVTQAVLIIYVAKGSGQET